jgi:hypothetical protein
MSADPDAIDTAEALDRVAGPQPLAALLKSIDALDAHCEALLARSPFAVLSCCEPGGGNLGDVLLTLVALRETTTGVSK